MKTSIQSLKSHRGFYLEDKVQFEGPICAITGKNGVGKTRLLQSIVNGSASVTIDDVEINNAQVSLLNMPEERPQILTNNTQSQFASNLAKSILSIIDKCSNIENIPTTAYCHMGNSIGMSDSEEINLKDIVERAEKTLNKPFTHIGVEELELSIILNKEIINGKTNWSPINLSQLVSNYHQAFNKNLFLKFMHSQDHKTSFIDDDAIKLYLGEHDPYHYFNEIIEKLFRRKYSVTPPSDKISSWDYSPNLVLNSSGEKIVVDDLSSGEKIIFWLAEKIFINSYSSNKYAFRNRTIILIDEPDSHLHPQMIVDFYDCLKVLSQSLNLIFIFSTHSPTTIALCPTDKIVNIFHNISNNSYSATNISKDNAISELLDGVSQISINPVNNRQVYVENVNDHTIFEFIFNQIKNRSSRIDRHINLSFVSAGKKFSESELKKILEPSIKDNDEIERIIQRINGDGNCQQVIGMVQNLRENGNLTVRGLIDWDKKTRNHSSDIKVLAKNRAYSIENLVYDPLGIFAHYAKNLIEHEDFKYDKEKYDSWTEVITDDTLLQNIIDNVTKRILCRENAKNYNIEYLNGKVFSGDQEFFIPKDDKNGHDFADEILKHYPAIKRLEVNNRFPPLIYQFMSRATVAHLERGFIRKEFEEAFVQLQK